MSVLVVIFALCGSGTVQAAVQVTDITFAARSDGNGYVVRAHLSESIAAYGIPRRVSAHVVEWVLYDARLSDRYRSTKAEGPVQSYSATWRDGHLVFRFRLDPDRPVTTDAYRDRGSTDLLLNLEYETSPAVADASTKERSSEASSGPPVQKASLSEPEASASSSSGPSSTDGTTASAGEKTVSAASNDPPSPNPGSSSAAEDGSSTANTAPASGASRPGASREARERWKLDTVVIDPGHGGKDPGATANGHYEKTIVLSVAKKLGDYLEDKLGLNVEYTRTTDRFIALKERGRMANQAGAKLFISLHVNAARSRRAKGTETYFLGRHKTEAARKVMERENSVIRYEENTDTYDSFDPQKLVVQELAQSMFMQKSEELAGLIQHQFANRVHRKNRGVHQAGFYVLWSASMPSVLVELGFLTNPAEARFLTSEKGQVYLASALFRAVRAYKTQYEKGIETASRE